MQNGMMGFHMTATVCLLLLHTVHAKESSCPCITPSGLDAYRNSNGDLFFEPAGQGGERFSLPSTYGSSSCSTHDFGVAPYCSTSSPPSWCARSWCYVDPDFCTLNYARSIFFQSFPPVYFSYATCEASGSTFAQIRANEISVREVVDRVHEYTCATKRVLEDQLASWGAGNGDRTATCAYLDSCPCTDCQPVPGWGQSVLLQDSVLVRPAACTDAAQFQDESGYSCRGWVGFECAMARETWGYSAAGEAAVLANCPIACERCEPRADVSGEAECLAQAVRDTYSRTATAEYGDQSSGRVGYQYYGLQADGTMVQWPGMSWCPTQFDPRFRPWYAAAAAGPKTVLLVLDASGSMCVDPSVILTPAQLAQAASIEERVTAGGGKVDGEIVISLGWEVDVDLDLHVITPDGSEIFWRSTRHDNGELDVDCVDSPCGRLGGRLPVENIVFSPSASERVLRGTYQIDVNVFSRSRHSGPIGATLAVKAGGCTRVFDLSSLDGRRTVYELSYGGVDAPGTTGLLSRMALARQAANKVIDTLTEVDLVGVVAFDGCTLKYSETLVRATDDERSRLKHWVNHLMPGSTTNFAAAFESAFEVLSNSAPSGCEDSTAIIFLTDGRPDAWNSANLARVRQLNQNLGAAMLTFTLGDDIDPSITNQLACENEGIYRHISRPADLDGAMAGYYHYFASRYRGCEGNLRWIEYEDAVTCTRLLAGCMPIFNGDALYGVTCMDANLIASLEDLRAQAGWSLFQQEYTQQARQCATGNRPDVVALRTVAEGANRAQDVDVTCASAVDVTPAAPANTCTKSNPMSPYTPPPACVSAGDSGDSSPTVVIAAVGGAAALAAVGAVVHHTIKQKRQKMGAASSAAV